jgi:hypothetical protein
MLLSVWTLIPAISAVSIWFSPSSLRLACKRAPIGLDERDMLLSFDFEKAIFTLVNIGSHYYEETSILKELFILMNIVGLFCENLRQLKEMCIKMNIEMRPMSVVLPSPGRF